MNTRMIAGIVLLVIGILVLIYPALLAIVVGVGMIIGGLYLALQSAGGGNNGGI